MCLNLLGLLRDSVLRGDSFCGPYLLVNNVMQDTPKTLNLFSFDSVPPRMVLCDNGLLKGIPPPWLNFLTIEHMYHHILEKVALITSAYSQYIIHI